MSEVTIMDLPRVIMVEILSRLPIKPIFRCKTVCKLWYHLLTKDPLFVNTNFPCILLTDGYSNLLVLELKADYDYYSLPRNRPIELSPKFHLPPVESYLSLVGSCNGFICLLNGSWSDKNHCVYISNPLLGEYFKLQLPKGEKSVCGASYEFSFSEASGQYKVLRLVDSCLPQVSELQVYTLGVDENWRNVGLVPFTPRYSLGNVNVNGSLHWMDHKNYVSIYSFNIGTEEVKTLPAPPGLETTSAFLFLEVLGNCLCLTVSCSSAGHFDIWWMKEYGVAESWIKDRIQDKGIPRYIHCTMVTPIIIWKDGEILMQSDGDESQLISYNREENKFRKVKVYGNGYAPSIYIPSFYSLKTIMGNNFQVSNVYPKTEIV